MGRKAVASVLGLLMVGVPVGMVGLAEASVASGFGPGTRAPAVQLHGISANYITARPIKGPGGTEVRVTGLVVGDPRCHRVQIFFTDSAGSESNFGSVNDGPIDITIHVPLGAALGQGLVRAVPWTYRYPPPRCGYTRAGPTAPFTVNNGPGIFGFMPRNGPVGTVVTITGIRFGAASKVKFNGTLAVFTVDSDSQITATVPMEATTGPIKIVTPAGKALSGPDFVVCSSTCGRQPR